MPAGARDVAPASGIDLSEVTLGERVGQGVSGHVFRGTHIPTGAAVAVKVYSLEGPDPAFRARERFWRECRILSLVTHPAFPRLYGCGEVDGKTGFAVMEWIAGRGLDDFRTARQDVVLRLATGILGGLRALHRAGFLHRDIAFDNVLVESRRSGLYPRIIDLGVAKTFEVVDDLTRPGNFLGRVGFAAPEALTPLGSLGHDDPKSDLFSFGVLLYEWLCGAPPFAGSSPAEIFRSQERFTFPSSLRGADGRAVDPELAAYVLSLLARSPESRPSTDEAYRRLLQLKRNLPGPEPFRLDGSPERLIVEEPRQVLLRGCRIPCAPPLPRLYGELDTPAPLPVEPERESGEPGETAAPDSVSLRGVLEEIGRDPRGGRLVLVIGIMTFLCVCGLCAWFLWWR